MTISSAPFGAWPSPVSRELLVAQVVSLGYPRFDGDTLYWEEMRPNEGGRGVVVRQLASGIVEECFGPEFSVGTMVHEYGGRSWTVHQGILYFSQRSDQRLYRVIPGQTPVPITAEPPDERSVRFADPVVTPSGSHLICVRETHRDGVVINDLVTIATDGASAPMVVAGGCDFYAHPTVSPQGQRVAWICWNHPSMPWDATELYVAELSDTGQISGHRRVGTLPEESVLEPQFDGQGILHFASDRSGWWNIYREDSAEALLAIAAECAHPLWQFGNSSYTFANDGALILTWSSRGQVHLGEKNGAGEVREWSIPYSSVQAVRPSPRGVVAIVGGPDSPPSIVVFEDHGTSRREVATSFVCSIPSDTLSHPETLEFSRGDGSVGHCFFYPPRNAAWVGPVGALPPVIVQVHGGPTSQSLSVLSYRTQFWTSRGFAVVDVNYAGSTGYGREYRNLLRGGFGALDVQDCVDAAQFLVTSGRVNPDGLFIHGGSSGGMTTLNALAFHEVFTAGASYYGIADLTALASDTHKFEARYLDSVVAPWPEGAELYRERSVAFHKEKLRRPVIIFQGLDDTVVPPDQAEVLVTALRSAGVPFAYISYEGEGHGFRQAANIMRTAEAELSFYGQVLGIAIPDIAEPVFIENAQALTTA